MCGFKCSLKKDLTPKIRMLCFFPIINSILLNLSCVLPLICFLASEDITQNGMSQTFHVFKSCVVTLALILVSDLMRILVSDLMRLDLML